MGLFSGLSGNASQGNIEKVEQQLEDIMISNEVVELAFNLIRDLIVFTNVRLILVDQQGMTGKKTTYKSIPYRSISRFSIETTGYFDLDAELKIWISSASEPSESLTFTNDDNIIAIQKVLAEAVLR
ncbi:MAG: PH domain-containing protein [Streptococcus sp.]|nr:PH domain-containing protein [Streptococcus sp.]